MIIVTSHVGIVFNPNNFNLKIKFSNVIENKHCFEFLKQFYLPQKFEDCENCLAFHDFHHKYYSKFDVSFQHDRLVLIYRRAERLQFFLPINVKLSKINLLKLFILENVCSNELKGYI